MSLITKVQILKRSSDRIHTVMRFINILISQNMDIFKSNVFHLVKGKLST
jgi:hypothetical protein